MHEPNLNKSDSRKNGSSQEKASCQVQEQVQQTVQIWNAQIYSHKSKNFKDSVSKARSKQQVKKIVRITGVQSAYVCYGDMYTHIRTWIYTSTSASTYKSIQVSPTSHNHKNSTNTKLCIHCKYFLYLLLNLQATYPFDQFSSSLMQDMP